MIEVNEKKSAGRGRYKSSGERCGVNVGGGGRAGVRVAILGSEKGIRQRGEMKKRAA
jgi:hypothetical protein